jgi:hypothetical protein
MLNSHELTAAFCDALESSREEDVQRFLAAHDEILIGAFCPNGTHVCIPKLRLGNEYVTDFAIVQLFSTITQIVVVELEPPTMRPFNRDGSYARRLNGAVKQVSDWLAWRIANHDYFCESIIREVNERLPKIADVLRARIRYQLVEAKIVIGRRPMLTETDNHRRAAFYLSTARAIEIVPYDRLLDTVAPKL